ncbi:GNAT family N-acetyltransferase [Schleiferilactobacillus shenzhenensis]|uniref:Diamine N-acetyltransferase n=1 Tax=Schleiferilactobacillus shenzhenensis LY-73 TaxID=1231336 RepID=U4TY23_9LACO|nr:GNAT family N-acetyltransferase [Schleiferilactobacillus shenzhenensis]ERL66708.1 diamine N-acetyltransferase [Schleiferilactobacillus shenzhenensis LY-73]
MTNTVNRIVPVTEDNFWPVVHLHVAADQQDFIESNALSLAEAGFITSLAWHPYALIHADRAVGFAMIGAFNAAERYIWLDRLMIDQRYQHQGLGGAFLTQLQAFILERWPVDDIVLSYEPENTAAARFYRNHGFVSLDRTDPQNGEVMVAYHRPDQA